MENNDFENIRNALKNQSKYDYLKVNHWVEMDKVINDYSPRVDRGKKEFISFEKIASFNEFSTLAGAEVVADLFRFFINVDYEPVTSWVDELSNHELLALNYTLLNFPFSADYDITNVTLTDILKSIVGKTTLPEKFTRERIKYEETK